MSRCFPYPPPGYAGKSTSNEALIFSIKLQREKENAKSEKKKERRKEKKEKKEKKANGTLSGEKKILADEKLHLADKYGKYPKVCFQSTKRESSYEHMEKSSLTEEHGKPCCSSDSTENSGKRKRQSVISTSNNAQNHGTVIRIRLSTQKREDRPTASSKRQALCSTSGSVDTLSQKAEACVKSSTLILHTIPLTSNDTLQLVPGSEKESPCPGKGVHTESTSKDEVKLPKAVRRYRALFENWVPPPLVSESTLDDDQEWLLASKGEVSQPAKRLKCCEDEVASCGGSALQPQAHFLNNADIYALPFTVPF